MSSDHTWIRNSELRRIREQASRVQRAEAEAQRIRQQSAERERRITQQYQANINSINNTVQQIGRRTSDEIARLSSETRNALGQQAVNFRQQLEQERNSARAAIRQERERTDREISAINNRVGAVEGRVRRAEAAIDGVRRATDAINTRVNSMYADFSRRFDAIAQREADHRDRANIYLAQLSDLMTTISNLQPERFTDGVQYADLNATMQNIISNIENGQYDAAVSLAQNAIIDASRLVTFLTINNDEFNERLSQIRSEQNRILERIEGFGPSSQNEIEFTDSSGEEYSQTYDINEWSGGLFNELVSEFNAVSERLRNVENDSSIDIEELERIGNNLTHIDESITDCDSYARDELIRSYSVEDTARRIYDALSEEGFELGENGFENDDERAPFTLNCEDDAGNTVSVVIASGDAVDKPSFMIEAYTPGDEQDETLRAAIKDGVITAITEHGVEVEHTEHRNDCHKNPNINAFAENSLNECAEILQERRNAARARVVESI